MSYDIDKAPPFLAAIYRELQQTHQGRPPEKALEALLQEFKGDTIYISSRWYDSMSNRRRVRELFRQGVPPVQIAKRLGLTSSRIYQILAEYSPN
jgi:hypothetical protein